MKVQIHHPRPGLGFRDGEIREAVRVSADPESRYAVAELYANELFAAFRITARKADLLVGDYVDSFAYDNDVPGLLKFSVSWDCISLGFCKLRLWAPESSGLIGGLYETTVRRFYFDRALYEARREELHGADEKAPEDAEK